MLLLKEAWDLPAFRFVIAIIGFEILVIPFFWDAAVVNLVEIYEHCNGAYCLLVQCRLNITLP